MKKLRLLHVYYIPQDIEAGILYASDEFEVAAHLCPCGCKNKIITPLGAMSWTLSEAAGEATLEPSISNWQLPYWIKNGEIRWSYRLSETEAKAGWEEENVRIHAVK